MLCNDAWDPDVEAEGTMDVGPLLEGTELTLCPIELLLTVPVGPTLPDEPGVVVPGPDASEEAEATLTGGLLDPAGVDSEEGGAAALLGGLEAGADEGGGSPGDGDAELGGGAAELDATGGGLLLDGGGA